MTIIKKGQNPPILQKIMTNNVSNHHLSKTIELKILIYTLQNTTKLLIVFDFGAIYQTPVNQNYI